MYMTVEKNNVKVEVTKPTINFDAYDLEQAEKEKLEKQKKLIIATTALTGAAIVLSNVYKLSKKIKKKK